MPKKVQLWMCRGCHRIIGQEIVNGVTKWRPPHCTCGSPLGVKRVNIKEW
jgi:hypothetical protein